MRAKRKQPNISDVARAAGVSTATVSHALNGTRAVSEHSKALVMKAIKDLQYTPNAFARSFRTGKKNIIGFIVPDISNQFFARLIEAVEKTVSAEDYHLIIANTRENKERELQHLRYLTSGVVDGILLASTMEQYCEFSAVLPESFPTVLVDRNVDEAPFSSVTVSAYQSVYRSIVALIEQGQQRIGFITGLSRLSTSQERLSAYRQAMSDFGLTIEKDFIQYGDSMERSAWISAKHLLKKNCTAIVASNGLMGTTVYHCLHQCGVEIGRDVELVCFSDFDSPLLESSPVRLVAQPVDELGKIAGEEILCRIKDHTAEKKQILLSSVYLGALSRHNP
ncbi:LacI family DNA-binding transcriptional regulator [Murdochiella vaginalis]|uniref:LacI family DNA-binding transcriptional regulator n=1 Tax=Murdochiella vaginalis TaxID=1852373 RepID=UPI0008FE3E8F|nr:LacI family DNA-binding transcriptional regulator [Murdochiella vaginalis]